jgi:hypothetical protein
VDAWEVWNEPNLEDFWEGSIPEYVELLQAAYPAFKAGDPDAEVLLGGVAYNDTNWLEEAYDAGIGGYFDVMNTHPYMAPSDLPPEAPANGDIWRISHVGAVKDLMEENGDGGKPIWFTEFGWSSHENWSGVGNAHRGVTEQQQADYAVRSLEFIGENYPYVDNVFWYNERNRDTGGAQLDNYGILYRDLEPKPVYDALKAHLTGSGTPEPAESPSPEPSDEPDPEPSDEPTDEPDPEPTDEQTDDPDPEPSDPSNEPDSDPSDPDDGPTPDPTESPAPGDPTDEGSADNLLENGDFESGLAPWAPEKGKAKVVNDTAATGKKSTLVKSRGKIRALRSERVSMDEPAVVEASGYVKVPRRGQRIKLVLVEERDGKVISRWGIRLRVMSRGWVKIPTVHYGTNGDSHLVVKLRMRSRSGRYFWADNLRLSPASS